jgi:hypothetical protein
MRTKWRRYPSALFRWVVSNVEKVAFALAMLFLLGSAIRASQQETLAWTPEDLDKMADAAAANIQATTPPPVQIVRYSELAQEIVRPVSAASYAFATPFDPPRFRIHKRSTPAVYPVRELLASAGHGAFAVSAGEPAVQHGGYGMRGQRWVCLTGAIDDSKQTEEFRDALWQASCCDLRRDRPDYVYFRVERAEIDPRRPEAAPRWVRQNVRNMFLRQQAWPQSSGELADPRYLPPERGGISLVFPLGPLADRTWGPEVSHPRIPLQATLAAYRTRGPRHARTNENVAAAQQQSEELEYLLFRYFDYDVQPGREYRYRVRLLLTNPNYAVSPQYLEDENSAKNRYLEADWSEPSAIVHVPPDTQILAGPARTWGARATVMLTRFLASTGQVAFEEFQVRRGQLLDFSDRVIQPRIASTSVVDEHSPARDKKQSAAAAGTNTYLFKVPTGAPSRKEAKAMATVDYGSEMLLLDVRGGERLPGPDRFTEPASLCLMDGHGELIVRNELDDLPEYRSYQQVERSAGDAYASRNAARPSYETRGEMHPQARDSSQAMSSSRHNRPANHNRTAMN